MRDVTRFMPVAVLKNGVVQVDGHMIYTDGAGRWLYVSEDGMSVYMYNNLAQLIRDIYKRGDDDDFIVTGWDLEPYRFVNVFEDAYRYYNERFDN